VENERIEQITQKISQLIFKTNPKYQPFSIHQYQI